MAKYKLKALSVGMGGKVFLKSENQIFDTETPKFAGLVSEIEAGVKAGFFELIEDPKTTEKKRR